MATEKDRNSTQRDRFMIVRPQNGGIRDLVRFMVSADKESGAKFFEVSHDDVAIDDLGGGGDGGGGGGVTPDHRWVIFVSIVIRKIIAIFGKPMEWTGYLVEFVLNLLSLNGNLLGLLRNLFKGSVVMPQRGSETFISAIGHLDSRIDLYKYGSNIFVKEVGEPVNGQRNKPIEIGDRAIMDLCMMASKLAYENVNVVRNVVNLRWKMHFVDFYNCWNDYQKQMSTQVFILCDKPRDANLILISFRGTEPFDADDWSTDFDYSWYEIPNLGKLHMGFLEALGLGNRAEPSTFQKLFWANSGFLGESKSVFSSADSDTQQSDQYDQFSDSEGSSSSTSKKKLLEFVERTAYYAVRSKLKSLLEEHKNANFIVTGHSLGGALAIMFPTVLVLQEENELMQKLLGVYTFGQPRIGNRQLGRFMEDHLEHRGAKYFRVVYCNDLVPRLPYDNKTFLFKHFGMCLYYNSLFSEKRVDEEPNRNYFGIRYLIPEYINAVWELFRGLTIGYMLGPEYKEGWLSILLRIVGLGLPGFSAHSPTNYVNSVRLGRESTIQMSPL